MKFFTTLSFCSSLFIVLWATTTSVAQNPPYKSVNLGAWLVTERWMTPSLFEGIPNGELLDGTQVQFKSTSLNMYVAAENGGGAELVANRAIASTWETFKLWRVNETAFNFRVFNKDFIGLTGGQAFARANQPGIDETFVILKSSNDTNKIRIRASNGLCLQSLSGSTVTADYRGDVNDWSDTNPSVFQMTNLGGLHGEYQLTNGWGPVNAPAIMRNHWNTYIVADDFRFMSQNGLTAVRIPVGWWIMFDPNPPKPFVGGSLQSLDNAFTWAEQYNMKVIIDFHAVNGSQNGFEHSGCRDGYIEWGASDIPQSVAVIDFLAKRYGSRRGLAAIELMNEPFATGVTLDDLTNYYKQGYAAVRKYTYSAYVIISNRLSTPNNTELLPLANTFIRSVIDVHYYNLFSDGFSGFTSQQNIDLVYVERARTLQEITQANGPLSFVGEWTTSVQNSSLRDYQNYSMAQIDVYGGIATFGWSYWSYKCDANDWSLKWMIENNYISLPLTQPRLISSVVSI